jgi:tRNA/rRNA methyltransferase
MHIPTDPAYPAMNLAQAVTVCLYELRRTWLRQSAPPRERAPAAPFALQERMFADLRAALEGVHFVWGSSADSLTHAVRHLIGRAQPTVMEVQVLLGLARQLRWYVEHHPGIASGAGGTDNDVTST